MASLPLIDELIGATVTELQFKNKLKQLLEAIVSTDSLNSVIQDINLTVSDSASITKGNDLNLLKNALKVSGKRLDLAGGLIDSVNYTTTGFIPVNANDVIKFYTRSNNEYPNIVAYKSDKTFHSILFTGATVGGTTFHLRDLVIGSDIAFIRMAYITNSFSESYIKFVRNKISNSSIDTSYIYNSLFNQVNLFDISTITTNKYLVNNELRDSAGWNITDYIPVKEMTSYISNLYGVSTGSTNDSYSLGVHFYDLNQNFLGTGLRLSGATSFKTPLGCKFVRINYLPSSSPSPYIYLGDQDYKDFLNKTILQALLKYGALNNYDPIEVHGVEVGKFLTVSGELQASPNWSTSNFVPAQSGAILQYDLQTTSTAVVVGAFDENKVFIGPLLRSSTSGLNNINGTLEIPDGVFYIRLCFYNLASKTFLLSKKKESDTPSIATASRYTGKTWLAMGTSIVDSQSTSYTYPKWVTEYFNFTLYDHAISGTRTRSCLQRAPASIDSRITLADIITIDHGTNDFKLETALGTINDTPTDAALLKDSTYRANDNKTGTFYGDMKGVIEYIYSVKPSARIFLVTPIRRSQPAATGTDTNSLGHKLVDYRDAIVEIAKYYGLPLLDNYYESGFNAKTIPTWTADGLHPTEWAQKNVLANKMIGFIESN